MEVELNIDCDACNAKYTMMYESDDVRDEDAAFHCAFCGILMEPYYENPDEF